MSPLRATRRQDNRPYGAQIFRHRRYSWQSQRRRDDGGNRPALGYLCGSGWPCSCGCSGHSPLSTLPSIHAPTSTLRRVSSLRFCCCSRALTRCISALIRARCSSSLASRSAAFDILTILLVMCLPLCYHRSTYAANPDRHSDGRAHLPVSLRETALRAPLWGCALSEGHCMELNPYGHLSPYGQDRQPERRPMPATLMRPECTA